MLGETKAVTTGAIMRGRWGTAGLAVIITAEIAALLVIASAVYVWAGWHRMESACQSQPHGDGVSYSWSWSAPGFTCTWSDGHRTSKLWW
jgi:hypothetical protein